jgi:hypothetical protein
MPSTTPLSTKNSVTAAKPLNTTFAADMVGEAPGSSTKNECISATASAANPRMGSNSAMNWFFVDFMPWLYSTAPVGGRFGGPHSRMNHGRMPPTGLPAA